LIPNQRPIQTGGFQPAHSHTVGLIVIRECWVRATFAKANPIQEATMAHAVDSEVATTHSIHESFFLES
jgi:hypothetical protein